MDAGLVLQVVVSGLSIGSIYTLVAIGLTISLNVSGMINCLHGEFVVVGGILSTVFWKAGVPLPLAVTAGAAAAVLLSVLTVLGVIQPMRRKKATAITMVMVTLGAGYIVWSPLGMAFGFSPVSLRAFSSVEIVKVLGVVLQTQTFWALGISVLVVAALTLFYQRTAVGQAMLACATNSDAAALMGINVSVMVILSFALAGGLAGIAGGVLAGFSALQYSQGLALLLKAFGACLIGGLGNTVGAIVGGLLLGLVEAFSGLVFPGEIRNAVVFLVLLLFLLFRPNGLFGSYIVD